MKIKKCRASMKKKKWMITMNKIVKYNKFFN